MSCLGIFGCFLPWSTGSQDPVLSPSGYTYCYPCISGRIRAGGGTCPCPMSGQLLHEGSLEANALAASLIEQIEVYPAKRMGKFWVPIRTGASKSKSKKAAVPFGLRRLYKNTIRSHDKRKAGEGKDSAQSKARSNYDAYELFTYFVVASLLIYFFFQSEFLGPQLHQAKLPLLVLMAVPMGLLLFYTIYEMGMDSGLLPSAGSDSDSDSDSDD
mmetsp:Transcript_9387/g.24102  ORF Transcript_9387/g.24102 Transcript_9387/m.24102 type:complete len:214 (-) Transcript_9387:160-801(-)